MKPLTIRLLLVGAFLALIGAFYALGLHEQVTLEGLKANRAALQAYVDGAFVPSLLAFGVGYVVITALSLPIASLITLLAGGLFGVVWGTVLVSFASTAGATLAMLAARFVLRDAVQARYGAYLKTFNQGFAAEGPFYLFAIRLAPIFPFFMVNLLMGLLPIKVRTYWWVSQLGMLPGTVVYVYAGTALGEVTSVGDIVSWQLLLAFGLLAVLPLATRKILLMLKKGRERAL